jgi:transposase
LIRTILTDAQWERIAPLLPGKEGDPGRSGGDNRAALEGMLWIVRTGAPWRDLPECFGKWFSVWKRFRRWAPPAGLFRFCGRRRKPAIASLWDTEITRGVLVP